MDDYLDSLKKARRNVQIADHMLTQTYPLVKDPKLLIAVLDNIFLAMSNGLDSIVYYEREQKKIPPFHNSFESKYEILKLKLAGQYDINNDYLMLMRDLRNMVTQHKESPVEFARKDKFVICSEEYDLTSISLEKMKAFIAQARKFVNAIEGVVGE